MSTVGARTGRLLRNPAAWVMLGLTLLSVLQRPGRTTFDTKLDLAVDPVAFLARALHLWNPEATGGELQNQAYGYLFPMGPFFAAGQLLGVPPWITQRAWCALLLCLAFGGMLALARALRVGTEPTRFAGALAYTLAPRMLTEIGPLSAEMLPAVALPWVLLPLVRAGRIGSPRRAAGLSALAVLCMGGVNAAMVLMALVLPALWLLTRRWTAEHVRLTAWWGVSVLAVCLWWVLPLLLLGEYSLPFLDYIESATNTTAPMSLWEVLRGTNQWVAYVVAGTPWWPSGFMLIDNPALMLVTGLVAAVGLFGLVLPRLPERRFLTLGVVTGLVLLTVGYVGTLDGPLAVTVRELLDGPLAPLRNVHKFEPVLRLPLTLAFTHALVGRLPGLARGTSALRATRARVAVGCLLVALMAAPAWLLTLRPGPGWAEVPDHWRAAMTWLADRDPDARTLLLPGSGFGDYTWGRTVDEPAQALARAPWAVRSQIPLGSEGNTRLMDAVEEALTDARGSPALSEFLARAGYRFLLMRNDIDLEGTGAPDPGAVRAGLAGSSGLSRVASFGPSVALPDVGRAPALEVYEVDTPVHRATLVSTSDVPTVSGGPESLLPLLESGLLDAGTPTVLAGDGGSADAREWLVTDGLRYRERNVGRVRDSLSQTLAADEEPRQRRPSTDVLPFRGREHQTVAAYRGIRGVSASTSIAFADAVGASDPSGLPFAAVDGDPLTAWRSSSFTGPDGQWLEVELDTPLPVSEVGLRAVDSLRVGWPVTRVRITTDTGSTEHDVARGGGEQRFPTAAGLTSTVRVTVLGVAAGRQTGNVAISELSVPGVAPLRALRAPADATPEAGQLTAYAFSRGTAPRYACVGGRCSADRARVGEEPSGVHRLFSTSSRRIYRIEGTVLPATGGTVPASPPGMTVSGSSQLAGDPTAGALSAVDGDSTTSWVADGTDLRPTLRLSWDSPRALTGLRLTTSAESGGARPTDVLLTVPRGSQAVPVTPDGVARFSLTTDRIEISVLGTDQRMPGPAGITELTLSGVDLPAPPVSFEVPCGSGPTVELDGFVYQTSVSGSLADYRAHRPLRFTTCGDLGGEAELTAGEHELRTTPSASFVVQDLRLAPVAAPATPTRREHEVTRWEATRREVTVGAGPEAVLAVPENANEGWTATMDGRPLERTRVDGWQQAWLVPAGAGGTVALEFVPDGDYRRGLMIGGLTAVLLAGSVLVPARRRRQVDVRPGGRRWVPVALVALLAVLGGMLPLVLLIACLLLRLLWPPAPRWLVLAGAGGATVVALTGRLLDHGQAWAYGWPAQSALLLAVAAVVSTRVDWFDPPGSQLDQRPAGDEQAGGDPGGRDDLGQAVVQPEADEQHLDPHGEPDQHGRPPVGARDAGEQQDLGEREQ
ncbi:coagulation factor 5/8 type [Actinophytocola xanthii]|uniref:Coagulation factor 5/8 type n=1 Tax=Actinophytocola xanthii TaxID=1912961 RepID=A0A1Q8CTV9_9PSEU|nr:coagulation factor 5/8 type [Actinophytocola xanthii]